MDLETQALVAQFAEVAVRNSASAVTDRIAAARAKRKDKHTIAEMEEIISDLISDKSELVRITQALEQELVAQRISPSDVEYITDNIVPVIKRLAETVDDERGGDPGTQEFIDLLEPLLSVETINVMQLLGFNFRRAIGEPLTQLVSRLVLANSEVDPSTRLQVERLQLEREMAYLEVAKDPEAYTRLKDLFGRD